MASKSPHSWFGGIDENGLGPRLGPLVVTGVLAQGTTDGARAEIVGPPSPELAAVIGDSKRLVGFGHSALGEAWARVILERNGVHAACPSDLVRHLSLKPVDQWRSDCPAAALPLCRKPLRPEDDRFESDDSAMDRVRAACDALESRGIRLALAKSAIVCTRSLNEAKDRGTSRLDVDLHCMEKLFEHFRQAGGDDLTVHCGKVGGLTFYTSHFTVFRPNVLGILHESRDLSVYESGRSQIRFVLDAEPKHQLVALASLIGKWLRDLLMNRLLDHLREGHPDWPVASGYNDRNTKALIGLSESLRREKGIPDDCFLRK